MANEIAENSKRRSGGCYAQRVNVWRERRLLVVVLCGTAAYLYLRLFTLKAIPLLLGGDQVYFWMDAMRLLDGERIYLDFFRYTPPGTDLFYAALFKLFGARVWVTNLAVLAMGLAFAWVCFRLSAKLVNRSLACVTTALYVVFVYGSTLNATNHWFAVLAIAVAVNVLMGGLGRGRLAAAGALLALSAFFNQAHGAAALAAVFLFLLWRGRRPGGSALRTVAEMGAVLLGAGVSFLLLNFYFLATVGWRRLWYCEVTYVLKYPINPADGWSLGLHGSLTWGDLTRAVPSLAMYLLLPVVYGVALRLCWSRRRDERFAWDRVTLLTLAGVALTAEVSVAINWLRLFAVSLPGVILLLWMTGDRLRRSRYAQAVLWFAFCGVAARQIVASHRFNSAAAEFAGGRFVTTRQNAEKMRWIAQRTEPGDLFFQAGWPGVYLPLHLRNPLFVATVDSYDAPRAEDIALAIQQLESKRVQYILWTAYLDRHCLAGEACSDLLSPLRDYLQASYRCVHVFPDGDALWERAD